MSATQPFVVEHPHPNLQWVARHSEEILDPALPIIDPHHHLWDRPGSKYGLDELMADLTAGHNIVATVFLQCFWAYRTIGAEEMRPVGETEFVAAIVDETKRRGIHQRVCAAIVGHVDFRAGEAVDAVLEAHIAAGRGRFRGIRQVSARHPDFLASISTPPPLGLLGDPAFRTGFARLHKYELTFDAWLYHTQFDELLALARFFPETPIVINHVGGPLGIGPFRGRTDDVFAAWHSGMKRLATCPNVHVKLGGLAMAINGFDFHKQNMPPTSENLAKAWRPWMIACIEAFGAERCMFESNFPVDKAMCSYPVLWNAFKRIAADATADEKRNLFHDAAARFYRIEA